MADQGSEPLLPTSHAVAFRVDALPMQSQIPKSKTMVQWLLHRSHSKGHISCALKASANIWMCWVILKVAIQWAGCHTSSVPPSEKVSSSLSSTSTTGHCRRDGLEELALPTCVLPPPYFTLPISFPFSTPIQLSNFLFVHLLPIK